MQWDITVVSIAGVFFFKEKTAIIIAIAYLAKKTLHWQLSKGIAFGMYSCNFKPIN